MTIVCATVKAFVGIDEFFDFLDKIFGAEWIPDWQLFHLQTSGFHKKYADQKTTYHISHHCKE